MRIQLDQKQNVFLKLHPQKMDETKERIRDREERKENEDEKESQKLP